jgi:hypothetical protein
MTALRVVPATAGSMSFEGEVIGWVAIHRRHHALPTGRATSVHWPVPTAWTAAAAIRASPGRRRHSSPWLHGQDRRLGEHDLRIWKGRIMTSTIERTAISLTPAAEPRLRLQPDRSARTLLDGGWWPRSADPAAELPGLILALDERHGPSHPVTRVMLGMAGWNPSRPRRLRVDGPAGSRVVRLGWFATMPAGLLTATSTGGQRTDLVTVPPDTSEQDARAAMDQAAQAGYRTHAPALLAALARPASPARPATGTAPPSTQLSTWEWEGGQLPGPARPAPSAGPHATLLPVAGPRHP